MSSREQVLKSLQLPVTEDSPGAQVVWDAILCGQDASVEAAKAIWTDSILLPAFSRWRMCQHHKLLVVADRALTEAEMTRWMKQSECVANGYAFLTPAEINTEKLRLAGCQEGSQVILVILHAKEDSTSLLRAGLQVLPLPNQVILGVELWDESMRQLASEILNPNAVEVSIPPRPAANLDGEQGPSNVDEDQKKGEKDQEDEAHLVASFMANIISRSDDHDFRAACLALIKAAVKDTMPQGAASIGEMEDAEFRDGLAALMAQHQRVTSKPSKPKSGKGKKRSAELQCSEAKRLAAADWDDCSDSFDI